jgi:hypothetical protein
MKFQKSNLLIKNVNLGVVEQACNFSTREAEAGGAQA